MRGYGERITRLSIYALNFVVVLGSVVVGTTVVVGGVVVAIVIVTSACAKWRWREHPRHTTRRSSAMTSLVIAPGKERLGSLVVVRVRSFASYR